MDEVLTHMPRKVSEEMNAMLNVDYTKEEVKTALFQMFPTKAPGQMVSWRIFISTIGIFVGMM